MARLGRRTGPGALKQNLRSLQVDPGPQALDADAGGVDPEARAPGTG